MKKITIAVIVIAAVVAYSFTNNTDKKPKGANMKNELDSISYSIGVNIAKNMKTQGLEELNSAMMAQGVDDVFTGTDLKIAEDEANTMVQMHFQKMQAAKIEKEKEAGSAYLEANKKKPGVQVTASGLQYRILKEGTGPKPKLTDKVNTHYHGTTIDGKVFDSSVERGQPISFPLTGVIKGWTEALQLMPVGSKWELVIPYDLAYGERGSGAAIAPYSTLIFEVELLGIE